MSGYLSHHPLYRVPLCSVPVLSTHRVLVLVALWTVEEGGPGQGEKTAAVAASLGAS